VTADSRPDESRSFEELVAELEELTERLAAGDLGIEASADLYERAERLHALATERLGQVKARVERLAGEGAGEPAS
jgi:exodeoxyribonuclease VII small subunit